MLPALIPAIGTIATATVTTAITTIVSTAVSVFGGFLVRFLSVGFTTRLIAVGLLATITAASITGIISIADVIQFYAPPQFNQAVSLVVPDNSTFSVGTIISCKIARWLYTWKFFVIEKLSG
ncbi:hypothetical protein BOO24_07460 [Vibrio navarrensis]|uniref:DUF5455 family protein n=1 Tax=Vibrio navarrensis TaxID=29495 RepID=UPI001869CF47|nr:DUF5455 family protein [Vibrio navarrensis]MBE4592206.1 hypothetical protein [Vibrio navarrensis]